jgi:hypothetical protein
MTQDDDALYDITSSHHGGNRCSEDANRDVAPFKANQRFVVLQVIYKYTRYVDGEAAGGISSDAVEAITGMRHQSCGSRFTELKQDGLIIRIGYTKTRSGCRCAAYVVTKAVYDAMKEMAKNGKP